LGITNGDDELRKTILPRYGEPVLKFINAPIGTLYRMVYAIPKTQFAFRVLFGKNDIWIHFVRIFLLYMNL
jgi:hypothetical protein